jgi:hypothetical protein
MKKENLIVAFYILYFSWLFTVTYLIFDPLVQNVFTIFVTAFYFVFLRERWDLVYFLVAALIPYLLAAFYLSPRMGFSEEMVIGIPVWMALAWGTTVLALKKLYIVILKK